MSEAQKKFYILVDRITGGMVNRTGKTVLTNRIEEAKRFHSVEAAKEKMKIHSCIYPKAKWYIMDSEGYEVLDI